MPITQRRSDLAAELARDGRPKYVIAAEALIAPQLLAKIVGGTVEPTPAQRQRIAQVLGVDEPKVFAL